MRGYEFYEVRFNKWMRNEVNKEIKEYNNER
jgi:hypothetical protein